jgi:hypothetical protein
MPLRLGLMLTALFILSFIIFQLLDGSGRHYLAASAYGTAKAKLCSDQLCMSGEAVLVPILIFLIFFLYLTYGN